MFLFYFTETKRTRVVVRNDSFTESLECSKTGQRAVRKVISLIAKNSSSPYGPELLQNPALVIKAIETLPVNGKTMLLYFVYVIKALKQMALARYPKALTAQTELQKYKDLNYQHFSKSSNERKLSQARKDFVDMYKAKYEAFLGEVSKWAAFLCCFFYV